MNKDDLIVQKLNNFISLSWFDLEMELYQCYLISPGEGNVTNVYPATLFFRNIKKDIPGRNLQDIPKFQGNKSSFRLEADDSGKESTSFMHIASGHVGNIISNHKSKMLSMGWKENAFSKNTEVYPKTKMLYFIKQQRECTMSFTQMPNSTETLVFYTVIQK
ncbi:hypothetical protein JW960_05855 [candidate division KSB1 bacterium]|nr:hypothetical protein [candidate division KSB1 bacterium]